MISPRVSIFCDFNASSVTPQILELCETNTTLTLRGSLFENARYTTVILETRNLGVGLL